MEKLKYYVETQLGIELTPCDYFTGRHENANGVYYNFYINDGPLFRSEAYSKLQRWVPHQNIVKRVSANGPDRVAIFV